MFTICTPPRFFTSALFILAALLAVPSPAAAGWTPADPWNTDDAWDAWVLEAPTAIDGAGNVYYAETRCQSDGCIGDPIKIHRGSVDGRWSVDYATVRAGYAPAGSVASGGPLTKVSANASGVSASWGTWDGATSYGIHLARRNAGTGQWERYPDFQTDATNWTDIAFDTDGANHFVAAHMSTDGLRIGESKRDGSLSYTTQVVTETESGRAMAGLDYFTATVAVSPAGRAAILSSGCHHDNDRSYHDCFTSLLERSAPGQPWVQLWERGDGDIMYGTTLHINDAGSIYFARWEDDGDFDTYDWAGYRREGPTDPIMSVAGLDVPFTSERIGIAPDGTVIAAGRDSVDTMALRATTWTAAAQLPADELLTSARVLTNGHVVGINHRTTGLVEDMRHYVTAYSWSPGATIVQRQQLWSKQSYTTMVAVGALAGSDDGRAFAGMTMCNNYIDRPSTCEHPSWRFAPGGDAHIDSGPTGATKERRPQFAISLDPSALGGTTMQCAVDATADSDWKACTSPFRSATDLADGPHVFGVRSFYSGAPGAITNRSFTVDATAPTITITSGPIGQTTERAPAFEFTTSEDGVFVQCRITSAAAAGSFAPCQSPVSYVGLADGEWTFEAQGVDAVGNATATTTTRGFTVIPSGPVGGVGGGGTGGGVTPGGGAGGGDTNSGSSGGGATGGDGTSGDGGTCALPKARSRTTRALCPAPKPASCPAGKEPTRSAGAIALIALNTSACFAKGTGSTWTANGRVAMNGLVYTGKISLDMSADVLSYEAGTIAIGIGGFSWPISAASYNVGGHVKQVKGLMPASGKIRGFAIAAVPELEFSREDGGQTKLTIDIMLPDYLTVRRLKRGERPQGAQDGVGGGFVLTASNAKGLEAAGKLTLSPVYAGGFLELQNVSIGINSATGALSGSAAWVPPGWRRSKWGTWANDANAKPEVAVSMEMKNGRIVTMSVGAQRIDKPLGWGMFLQTIKGEFSFASTPSYVAGALGVSFLPHVQINSDVDGYFALLTGTGKFSSEREGIAATVDGALTIANQPIGNATLVHQSWDGVNKLSGNLSVSAGPYGAFFDVTDGEFRPGAATAIRVDGVVRVPFTPQGAGRVLIGDNGIVGCLGKEGVQSGAVFMYALGRFVTDESCDIGKWEKAITSRRSVSAKSGRMVSEPVMIDLPAKLPAARFAVRGIGSAPQVVVRGPDGFALTSPADGTGINDARVLLYSDPADQTTYVTITAPAGGRWSIEQGPSSSTILDVRSAHGLPQPQVSGKVKRVTGGRSARRTLTWRLRPIPGQNVQFVERGAFGSRPIIRAVVKATGSVAFTPAPGRGGVRRILAVVSQGGMPRAELIVATFTAPTPPVLVRPKQVTISRTGATVTVRLARQPAATSYTVQLRMSDGRRRIVRTSRPSASFRGIPAAMTGTVRVWASNAEGLDSPLTTVKLTRAKKPRRTRR